MELAPSRVRCRPVELQNEGRCNVSCGHERVFSCFETARVSIQRRCSPVRLGFHAKRAMIAHDVQRQCMLVPSSTHCAGSNATAQRRSESTIFNGMLLLCRRHGSNKTLSERCFECMYSRSSGLSDAFSRSCSRMGIGAADLEEDGSAQEDSRVGKISVIDE